MLRYEHVLPLLDYPIAGKMRLPQGFHILPCRRLLVACSSHDQGWSDNGCDGTYAQSYTWSELQVTPPHSSDAPLDRVHVTANVRADDTYHHHRRTFGPDDQVVQHVLPGSTIELYLRSQYAGWANYVNYGALQASFVVEIDEKFDFRADFTSVA
ncbi:TPA: hypothetical protein N0F65_009596 [Lagenidium giganteum]|uniref:Uncharacterized protein n=1 Tax=Lagenidium giganteum TaxID=4803 RepID=A0AAV2YJ01_9STRA|nr:TPA: hypothetical protein N0F65_009596 [Lagenidium giganteum]